eukprot:g27753.t1
MAYNSQLIEHQFRHATAKTCNDLLRRQTWDTTDRIPFVIKYFPGAEKLCHVLRSFQQIIDDNEHLAKIFPTPPNNRQILNRPLFAANYSAFKTTSTITLYNPVMATSARHVKSLTRTLPSHVGTPPTMCIADTH